MGQLIVQDFVSADGFAADANNEFTFYEYLDGGTAEFDRSQLKWLETVDTMVLGGRRASNPVTRSKRSRGSRPTPAGTLLSGEASPSQRRSWTRASWTL